MTPLRLGFALVLGVLVTLALPAGPASAHAGLVRTSPVQGSVVQQPPSEVVVTFSEHVTPVRGKIHVVSPDGKQIDRGEPTVDGRDVHIPVKTDVPRGTYLVSYRVISADSHPVGAGFSYSVGAPSATRSSTSAASSAGSRTDRAVAIGVSTARFLGYAGLVLLAGPVLVLAALWPKRLSRRGPARVGYAGAGLVGVSTLLGLYLQAPYENGGGVLSASGNDLKDVLTSDFGIANLVRLAALLAALPLLVRHFAGPARSTPATAAPATVPATAAPATAPATAAPAPAAATAAPATAAPATAAPAGAAPASGRFVQGGLVVLAAVAAFTWPEAGHPATSNAPLLTVVADAAHLAAMAVWLGGLLMLGAFLLPRANGRELSAILPVWSNWAALSVTVLVLAGTAQGLIEVVTLGGLLHTTYGQLLLWKIGLLAAVLAVAAVSRSLVRRRFAGEEPDPRGPRQLRRTVLLEAAGAVVVLGLAAALVQTTPARTAVASTGTGTSGGNGIYSTTLNSNLYQLQLDIEPAQAGNNEVHLYAYNPVGAALAVKQWKVSAALPAQGIEPIDVPVLPITDSHATGTVTLPSAGNWQFSFTLRVSDFDEATVSTTVPVKS